MATTVGNFSAIDDTEVDAESPGTETLFTRLRDNSYWIDAGTRRTTQTSTTKVLTPDGSNGVAWVEVNTIAGVDGTKNTGSVNSTTWATITTATSGILDLNVVTVDGQGNTCHGSYTVDLSDNTIVGSYIGANNTGYIDGTVSGTVSTGTNILPFETSAPANANVTVRRDSGNFQINCDATFTQGANYSWVIL